MYFIVVSHRCVSFVSESLGTGCVGRVGTIKDLNPQFPVLKAGHSVSYSCVCDVDREWVNGVGFFLFFLNLASVLCTCFSCMIFFHKYSAVA